jgi:hypothetical protein
MTSDHTRWVRPKTEAEEALEADVRLTPGHDLGSVGFEAHAA